MAIKTAHELISQLADFPATEVRSNGNGRYWIVVQSIRTGEWLYWASIGKRNAMRLKAGGIKYNVDRGMTVYPMPIE